MAVGKERGVPCRVAIGGLSALRLPAGQASRNPATFRRGCPTNVGTFGTACWAARAVMAGCDGVRHQRRQEGEGVAREARMPEVPTEFGEKSSFGLRQRRLELMVMRVGLKVSLYP